MAVGNEDGVRITRVAITQAVNGASNELITGVLNVNAGATGQGNLFLVPAGKEYFLTYVSTSCGRSAINNFFFGKGVTVYYNMDFDINHVAPISAISAFKFSAGEFMFVGWDNNDTVAQDFYVNVGIYVVDV